MEKEISALFEITNKIIDAIERETESKIIGIRAKSETKIAAIRSAVEEYYKDTNKNLESILEHLKVTKVVFPKLSKCILSLSKRQAQSRWYSLR